MHLQITPAVMDTNYLLNSLLVTYDITLSAVVLLTHKNNLPHNTVDFSSLSKFKRCLIRADLSKYLLYCIDYR